MTAVSPQNRNALPSLHSNDFCVNVSGFAFILTMLQRIRP